MNPKPEISLDTRRGTRDATARLTSGWDIRNAPRNYLVLVACQGGIAFFSFAGVWLITHYLGSEGYGGIVAVVAASQLAQGLVNWSGWGTVRFGVDEFIETQRIARAFWLRLIILVANLALVLLLSPIWFPPIASWLRLSPDMYGLVVAHLGVTALWLHVQMALQGIKLPQGQAVLQVLERLAIFVGLVLLIQARNLTAPTAIICYIAGPALATIFGCWRLRHFIFGPWEVDRAFLRKFMAYSLPLLPMWLVGYLSGREFDAFFISSYLSTADLGIYSVATQITGIALQLPTLANYLLIPLFISLQKEGQAHRTERYFAYVLPTFTLIWGLLCSVAAACGYYLVPRVFGVQFADSVVPLWVLLAASCLSLPVLLGFSAYAHALSATYISMWASILGAITNVIFNALLIPRYGLVGCAWATVLMTLVSVLTFVLLTRRLGVVPVGWLHWAILPFFAGAVGISVSDNALLSFIVCLCPALIVAYWKRRSILETVRFSRRFANDKPA